jgi:CheY-like chemotaxis protein
MATHAKSPPQSKHTATHKVLVIDDDPIIAESLAEFLVREGYEAATAFDAAEAMEALAEAEQHTDGPSRVPHPYDLAICDVSMPGGHHAHGLRHHRVGRRGVAPGRERLPHQARG